MVVETRGGELVGAVAVAGEGDQQRAVMSRSSPNTPCQLVTVDPGEPDVSDHDVGAKALEDVECTLAVLGGVSLVAPHSQQLDERFGALRVIFDHQDPAGHRHRSPALSLPLPTIFAECMLCRFPSHYGMASRPPPIARPSKPMASTTIPSTARIQPMLADIPATPPKPSSAAMMAMTKKVTAQLNMTRSSSLGSMSNPYATQSHLKRWIFSVCKT